MTTVRRRDSVIITHIIVSSKTVNVGCCNKEILFVCIKLHFAKQLYEMPRVYVY